MKYVVTLHNRTYEVQVEEGEAMILDEYEALAPSVSASSVPAAPASVPAPAAAAPAPAANLAAGTVVEAPLPGNVLSIKVAPGDAVNEGDVLLTIEAMKMENEVVAPSAGTVAQVCVSVGQMVSTGDSLVVI